MIQIRCPWCGLRGAGEFHYAGDVRTRPDPAAATRQEWRNYLYFPVNSCGAVTETWYHRMGCRQFFIVERDTATNQARSPEEAGR